MSAVKRLSFSIPLQSEIEKYMKEKKGWPDTFCKYYSERFWNNYQAQGWKLSNGNQMKDWKAAFNSQWQDIRFQTDQEMFKKCGGQSMPAKVITMTGPGREPLPDDLLALEAARQEYARPGRSIAFDALDRFYDAIKKYKLWDPTLTTRDVEDLKRVYHGDEHKVKCAIVSKTFDFYQNKLWTFLQGYELRKRLNAAR